MAKRKKKWILLMLLSISLLFTSCTGMDRVEIYQRAIIQAVGVDYKDGEYIVNIQFYNSDGSGGDSAIDPAKLNALSVEGTGATISSAISHAESKQAQSLYFGHSRVLIISEEAAKEKGLNPILNFFNTATFSKSNVMVIVIEGQAKDLIELPIKEGIIPASALEDTLILQEEDGNIITMKLFDALRDLENKNGDALIPFIKINEKKEGDSGTKGGGGGDTEGEEIPTIDGISVVGTALFKDGKMTGYLDKDATKGLTWIRGTLEKLDITVNYEKTGLIGMTAYFNKSKFKGEKVDGIYTFDLNLEMYLQVNELIDLEGDKAINDDDLVKITELATQTIIDLCKKTFIDGIYTEKINITSSKNLSWKGSIQDASEMRENYEDYAEDFEFEIQAHAVLNKPGFELDYAMDK